MGPRAVLDSVKEFFSTALPGIEPRFPGHPIHILIIIDIVSEHLKVVQNIIRLATRIDFG